MRSMVEGAATSIERATNPPIAALAFASFTAAALALRMWHGFYFAQFGDEIEHILGAKILANGGLLYRDFIDEHGPLPYAAAQAYGAFAGWAHPSRVRIIPAGLALLAVAATAASPALRGAWERLCAAAIIMGLLAAFWIVQGLCFHDYQIMAGAFLAIATALDASPSWTGESAPPAARLLAGAAYVLPCFAGYPYGPGAVLLLASRLATRRFDWRDLRPLAMGAVIALAAALLWLTVFVDWVGYFTFHFILSQVFFAPYFDFTPWDALTALVPHGDRDRIVQTAGAIAGIAGWLLLFAPKLRRRWRIALAPMLLAFLALAWSNPRGSPIVQNTGFIVLAATFLGLALARLPRALSADRAWPRRAVLLTGALAIVACEIIGRTALSTPHGFTRHQMATYRPEAMGRFEEPWAIALRRAVAPTERVLALPFYPDFYILADRLPMRGYYDYLPWEADYAKHPWFGRNRDLCQDIQKQSPPVVFYNGWIVWSRYDPEKYMACVLGVLRSRYVAAPFAPNLLVRRDRLAAWNGKP